MRRFAVVAGWRALNVLLVVAFGIQVLVLYLHVAGRSIALPAHWIEVRIEEALGEGAKVHIGEAAWRAPMTIELTDFGIGTDSYSDPLLSVRTVVVQWSPGSVLWRDRIPESFVLEGVVAVVPAVHSGSGSPEKLIDDFVIAVIRQGRVWSIERADGYVLEVPLQMAGRLRPETVRHLLEERGVGPKVEDVSQPEVPLGARLGPVLGRMVEIREQLKAVERPYLALTLGSDGLRGITVDWLFSGRSVAIGSEFSSGSIFSTGECKVWAGATDRGRLGFWLLAAAQADAARWRDELKFGRLSAALHFGKEQLAAGSWPEVGLWVHEVESPERRLEAAWAHLNVDEWPSVSGRVMVQDVFGFVAASGRADTERGTADLEISARLDVAEIVRDEALVPVRISEKLSFRDPLSLAGSVAVEEGWTLAGVRFSGSCYNVQAYDIVAATLTGSGEYDPVSRRVVLRDLFLENDRYSVRGDYIEDLDRNRYRFLLSGSVVPTDLNSLLGEDWWDELFGYFEFSPGNLPQADLDLGGSWKRSEDRWRMYFGNVTVRSCRFRGIEYDEVDLMLYITPQAVTLYDMELRRDGQQANAVIQWVDDERGRDKWLGFSGASTLPLMPLATTIGEEVESIVRDFSTTGSVAVEVAGRIWASRLRPDDPEDIFLKVNFADAVSWQGYDFDHIAGDVRLLKGDIFLNNLDFGMAGGTGQGTLLLKTGKEAVESFHLKAKLANADHHELLASLPFTRDKDVMKDEQSSAEEDADPPAEADTKSSQRGELDLDLDLSGPVDDVNELIGGGAVLLRKGDLGRIHILGRLSRLMDWNVVHFGSFNLTSVDGEFTVGSGDVRFSRLEISGPTVRLDAQGDFTIDGQKLDFTVYVHPLGAARGPIMRTLSWAFDPVTRSFRVTVTGTWDDPEYTVGFNPLNVF